MKKLSVVLLLSFISLILFGNVFASVRDIKCLVDADKISVYQGEMVNVSVKLDDTKDINVYKAELKYNNKVWEQVSENNFSLEDNWQQIEYNEDNNSFILINKKSESLDNQILNFNLVAKSDAEIEISQISLEDIIVSDGVNEYKVDNVKKNIIIEKNKDNADDEDNKKDDTPNKDEDIEVKVDPVEEPIIVNPSTIKVTTKPVVKTTSTIKSTTTITEKTTTTKTTSTTKLTTTTKKNQKLKNNKKQSNPLIIIVIIAVIVLIILIIKYPKKSIGLFMIMLINYPIISDVKALNIDNTIFMGDINSNSIIDDNDLELLQRYLINDYNSIELEKVDFSKDNNISIIDLSLLIKQQLDNPYDTYNVTNITSWQPLPIVSQELLDKEEVSVGGEGCQWPIGMAISKDGKLMLIGTDVGGVYRSTDGGKTFAQANAGLNSRGVGAFAIDPHNSSYVIAIGINSNSFNTNGPHISEDGGNTWKITKSMLINGHRDIRDSLAYDESSYDANLNRTMIAYWSASYETEKNSLKENEKGLYKTTDGGYTWELINSELHDGTVKVNPYTGELYVSKSDGIYYSNDSGVNFKKIVEDKITGFDLIASEDKMSIFYCNSEGIYKSVDNSNFIKITSDNYPNKAYNLRVSPVDNNKMVLVNREGDYQNIPFYSLDGGITWERSILDDSLSMMPYNNRLSIPLWSPVDNKVWLFVQGDFVSSSIDSGKTFKWDSNGMTGILSGGLVHHNVYNPDIIYFGSQDYNGAITTDGGNTWKYVNMSGKRWGGFCYGGYAVDENTFFVGVADGWYSPRKLKITFDGAKTIIDTGLYFTQENLRTSIESSYQSPTNPKVLFAADLRSDDGGHTWKKMGGCINVYTHNPKGKKELYGMDESGEYVVVSYDDGASWTKVNKEKFQPNKNYAPLKIDDLAYDWKHDSIYVACGYAYLYRVNVNDGSQEYVINKYIEEYRKAPLNQKESNVITRVAVDPNDPNIVYCGGAGNYYMNDSALYRSVDGGRTFQVITSNTKNSIIKVGPQGGFETNSIEVNPKTGELLFAGGCFGLSKLSPPYPIKNK